MNKLDPTGLRDMTKYWNEVIYCTTHQKAEAMLEKIAAKEAELGHTWTKVFIRKMGRSHNVMVVRSPFSTNGPEAVAQILGS